MRSEALLGLWVTVDREPLGTERVRLSAVARDRVVADAQQVRSPRAPARASATPVLRSRPTTSRAPKFTAVDGGGLRAPNPRKAPHEARDKGRGHEDRGHEKGIPPGLAKKPEGLPPGLAKKPDGLPPGLAKKPDGLPPGQAKKA